MFKVLKRQLASGMLILIATLMLLPGAAFAQTGSPTAGVDAITMLQNLSKTYPDIITLITGACFLIGFIFALRGVYYLRVYGELRNMTQSQSSMRTPITLFVVSAIFMYIPNAFQTLITTAFGYDSPLSYEDVSSSIYPVILQALVGLVQIIGLLAFVKGWMILVAHASQGGGHATIGKALTHIIGGILCINIIGVVDVVWNTFGFQF